MSLLNSILKVFVGDKSKQDVKSILPIVQQIKSLEEEIKALSHDQLRGKTEEFKLRLSEARKETEEQIDQLKTQIESTEDID